ATRQPARLPGEKSDDLVLVHALPYAPSLFTVFRNDLAASPASFSEVASADILTTSSVPLGLTSTHERPARSILRPSRDPDSGYSLRRFLIATSAFLLSIASFSRTWL